MCSEIDLKMVMDALREMFDGDDAAVVRWLYKPTIFFDSKTPISMMCTKSGTEQVFQYIERLRRGMIS